MPKVHEGANRATESEAASFADELDRMEQDRENRLAQLDADYKQKKRALNKSVNSDQAAIYADAKKVGVKKGVLSAIVNGQRRIRKYEEGLAGAREKAVSAIDEMEDEDRSYARGIVEALGADFAGFGLGAAAVAKDVVDKSDGVDPVAAAASKAWEGDGAPAAAGPH